MLRLYRERRACKTCVVEKGHTQPIHCTFSLSVNHSTIIMVWLYSHGFTIILTVILLGRGKLIWFLGMSVVFWDSKLPPPYSGACPPCDPRTSTCNFPTPRFGSVTIREHVFVVTYIWNNTFRDDLKEEPSVEQNWTIERFYSLESMNFHFHT